MSQLLFRTYGMLHSTMSSGSILLCTPFQFQGVVGRFSQVKPKILFAVEAVMYNGKRHDQLEKLKKIVNGIEFTNHVLDLFYKLNIS